MMLESFKEKINLIQEGLVGTVKTGLIESTQPKNPREKDAGAAVLQHYQDCWQSIHNGAEQTSRQADRCDRTISQLHAEYEKQWRHVSMLSWMVSELPELGRQVEKVMGDLANLGDLYSDVELALLTLEETLDARECQEKQLQQRFEMTMYQEKRRHELQELEVHLSNQYDRRMKELELEDDKKKTERQQVFHQKFQEDLEKFQSTGFLEVPLVRTQEMNLESVNLSEDESELEAFLDDKPTKFSSQPPPPQLHFGAHGGSSAEANAIPPTSIENVDASSSRGDNVDASSSRGDNVDASSSRGDNVVALSSRGDNVDARLNEQKEEKEDVLLKVHNPSSPKQRCDISREESMYFTPNQTMENLQTAQHQNESDKLD